MFDIRKIFLQTKAKEYPATNRILADHPDAEIIEVASHWNIPQLHGNPDLAKDWCKVKREYLVLGVLSSMKFKDNGRSTDFVGPSFANGCAQGCVYCFTARRKGYANPVSLFMNYEQVLKSIEKHVGKLPQKTPNQCDPKYWTYDVGCNNDLSADALLSDIPKEIIKAFTTIPNAKASFATKYVNLDMLNYDPQRKTRIRFSLMPSAISKLVDVRTSLIKDRIAAIQPFYDAGYEVHLNLSPVIVYEGWQKDYQELFAQIDSQINDEVKRQLKLEVIFLTHNKDLHEVNKIWHPKAEELLWNPSLQEEKVSQYGGNNLRYKWRYKGKMIERFKQMLNQHLPYADVRYIF